MEVALQEENKVLNPWDQQPWESDVWFAKFQQFLTIPSSQRTLVEYWERFRAETGGGTSGKFDNAASKYKWLERAGAYDKHRAVSALKTQEAVTDRMRNATEGAMAILAEAMQAALLTGKKATEWPEDVKVALQVLESFSGKSGGIGSLLSAYQTFFGTKKHVTGDIKLFEIPIILDDAPVIDIQTQQVIQPEI